MGYSTSFKGSFKLDKPLKPEHLAYLRAFSETAHVKWRTDGLEKLPDPLREAVGLPLGEEGAYFLGESPEFDAFIIDRHHPPHDQPGFWCDWTPTKDVQSIEWNGMEKFYDYIDWLFYLIEDFLKPWGYMLNGEVPWQGDDPEDYGVLTVKDNIIGTRENPAFYGTEEE